MQLKYIFSRLIPNISMSAKVAMESIKQNAALTERTITDLKLELDTLITQYNDIRTQQLQKENHQLSEAVEDAKNRLIQLEIKNGVKQIPMPNQSEPEQKAEPTKPSKVEAKPSKGETKSEKPKKEKKPKETLQKAEKDDVVDVGRLDLRIAKVEDVQKHPDADSLYVLKINCGDEKPRTVCSGLVKHVPIDALRNKDVMLLCNLKPVKMRGIMSEAMVMCASSPDAVEVLSPPTGCSPGELVQCEGYTRNPDPVMNPKKKIFETVAPDLATNDQLQACYKGSPFNVPGKGFILATTLKKCAVK